MEIFIAFIVVAIISKIMIGSNSKFEKIQPKDYMTGAELITNRDIMVVAENEVLKLRGNRIMSPSDPDSLLPILVLCTLKFNDMDPRITEIVVRKAIRVMFVLYHNPFNIEQYEVGHASLSGVFGGRDYLFDRWYQLRSWRYIDMNSKDTLTALHKNFVRVYPVDKLNASWFMPLQDSLLSNS